jgi:DNA-binding XRE family transcriptional regulator
MTDKRHAIIFDKFRHYNPNLANHVVHYGYYGSNVNQLILTLDDGTKLLYHYFMNSYRKLNTDDRTKDSCKHQLSMRLIELMADSGITQKELAEKSGVSEASIAQYINKNKIPSLFIARQLAQALDCRIDDLLD